MPKRYLFRADTRTPDIIFNSGFEPRFPGGIQIQKGGQMIGGVSTSYNLAPALKYAAAYGGYVYLVYAEGINLLDHEVASKDTYINNFLALFGVGKYDMGTMNNLHSQSEIACERIPAIDIICARLATNALGVDELTGSAYINDSIPEDLINHHSKSIEFKILTTF